MPKCPKTKSCQPKVRRTEMSPQHAIRALSLEKGKRRKVRLTLLNFQQHSPSRLSSRHPRLAIKHRHQVRVLPLTRRKPQSGEYPMVVQVRTLYELALPGKALLRACLNPTRISTICTSQSIKIISRKASNRSLTALIPREASAKTT